MKRTLKSLLLSSFLLSSCVHRAGVGVFNHNQQRYGKKRKSTSQERGFALYLAYGAKDNSSVICEPIPTQNQENSLLASFFPAYRCSPSNGTSQNPIHPSYGLEIVLRGYYCSKRILYESTKKRS